MEMRKKILVKLANIITSKFFGIVYLIFANYLSIYFRRKKWRQEILYKSNVCLYHISMSSLTKFTKCCVFR